MDKPIYQKRALNMLIKWLDQSGHTKAQCLIFHILYHIKGQMQVEITVDYAKTKLYAVHHLAVNTVTSLIHNLLIIH